MFDPRQPSPQDRFETVLDALDGLAHLIEEAGQDGFMAGGVAALLLVLREELRAASQGL